MKPAQRFSRNAMWSASILLIVLTAGCGGGGGSQDPILGADVVVALVAPPGAVVPPGVVIPPVVVEPPVVVPPVVVLPPVTPGLNCPLTGPALVSTDPSNGNLVASTSTVGVANSGKRVTANFTGNMDASAITSGTFQLAETGQPAMTPASVNYNTTTKVASLITSAALLPDTNYLAVIEVPASSVPGADAGCRYDWTWNFKTAAVPAATPSFVNFGAANDFAIAATAGVMNTGATVINGSTVLNPNDTCNSVPVGGAGTFGLCGGAPPVTTGTVVTPTSPNTTLAQQVTDALRAAYLEITPPAGPPAEGSLPSTVTLATTTIGAPTGSAPVLGQNYFTTGVYASPSAITISDDITLDAQGDANAVFVFQAGSSITAMPGAPSPAAHTRIVLIGGAKASNVFWQAGASATIGNYAEWNGNVLAGASVTMQTNASSCGRLFAGAFTDGAFVFDSNIVSIPGNVNAPAGCL